MLYDKIEKICVQAFLEKEENHETRFEFLQIQRIASFSLFLYVLDISEKPRRFFFRGGPFFLCLKATVFTVAFLLNSAEFQRHLCWNQSGYMVKFYDE